MSRNKFISAAP